jgi:hypothetical protein
VSASLVAQIVNLLYWGVAVGGLVAESTHLDTGRLTIGDTADYQSALRRKE